jgi:signal transduction histidine kinase
VFYPRDLQEARHPEHELEAALRDGRYEEEGWRIRKDGSRFWANVLITAVYNPEGRHIGFAKVTRDTSERRRLEQDREGAVQALGRANAQLELLNEQLIRTADEQAQFLAVTAHELRTPIGLVAGSAELLSRHGEQLTSEESAELLDSIASGAARLRRLVGDLLTASKIQGSALDLRIESVSLRGVVSRAVTTAQSTHPGAEVLFADSSDLNVDADRDRLAQMLENLLLNAFRHGRAPVSVSLVGDDDEGRLLVSDSGAGVPENLRPRLFERFATGRAHGGTGLGLFIVRQLAQAQGGEATYESPTPERPGGTFVVSLPRSHPDVAPPT